MFVAKFQKYACFRVQYVAKHAHCVALCVAYERSTAPSSVN
jgi:hypothetical protein